MSERLGAEQLLELVLDPGSLKRWDEPVVHTRVLECFSYTRDETSALG